jgi:hypothetical protein
VCQKKNCRLWRHTPEKHKRFKKAYQTRFDKGSNSDFKDRYRQYIVFCKRDNKDKCNKAFKALVLNATTNDNFKKQDSDCFLTIFGTLSAGEAAFVSAELANKACAHLLITPTNATGPATKTDLFVYSTTAKSRYTFTVFIGIMVNTSAFKKFTTSYKQF